MTTGGARRWWVLTGLAVVTICAGGQTAASATHVPDTCGPLGCLPVAAGSAVAQTEGTNKGLGSAAPVVIRGSAADGHNAAPGAPGGMAEAAGASRHDFEELVQTTLGHPLPLFGRGLFANAPASFVPADHAGVPADYVVGAGDELILRSWGKVDMDVRATVDRNGQIFVPVVGNINVAGVPYRQLQDVIETSLRRQYRGFQLSVTLGQLRSMQIFVLGRVQHPGAYVVSALGTLVDALFSSGGPSATGTMRDIQVKRSGKVIAHLDVYELLLRGDKSADIPLIAGDVLFVPTVGAQVAVDGDVNMPAIFEVKPGADVAELLDEAGGLTSIAGTRRSTIEHIVDHDRRRSDDFTLAGEGLKKTLADGDVLRVFPISAKIENTVTLRGSVGQPGRYTWRPGMKISDVIPSREFLLTRAYYQQQNNAGKGESLAFGSGDRDKVAADTSHENEINWNYAAIERLDADDLSTHLIPFALGRAIAHPGGDEDKLLEAGDTISIYSHDDLPLPEQARAKFVKVDGEVVAPGTYRMAEGETLRDLLRHAGGLTSRTYLFAGQFTRESVRLEQEGKLRQMLAREQQEALSPNNLPHGSSETPVSAQGELALRQAYLARLGEMHPSGRVVLEVKPEARRVEDVPDFPLEDGDHFFLPPVPGTITVLGSVYNQGAMRYASGLSVTHYLAEAGGPSRDADKKFEFILRADGTLLSRQAVGHFDKLALNPGDSVVVPPRLNSRYSAFELRDWAQILSSFSLTSLAIKALKN